MMVKSMMVKTKPANNHAEVFSDYEGKGEVTQNRHILNDSLLAQRNRFLKHWNSLGLVSY